MATYDTHALLIGFRCTRFTNAINDLGSAMRERLGWRTSIYWIDGPDRETAQFHFENIAYAFRQNIKHPEEKIVLYYGGFMSKYHDSPEHAARMRKRLGGLDYGMLWLADLDEHGTVCADCSLEIEPGLLFMQILPLPNDTLFLFDSRSDDYRNFKNCCTRDLYNLDRLNRTVQLVAGGGDKKSVLETTASPCRRCQSTTRFRMATLVPGFNTGLTRNFVDLAATGRSITTDFLDSLHQRLHGAHLEHLLGSSLFPLTLRKPPSLQTQSHTGYRKAVALLLRWPDRGLQSIQNCKAVVLMQEALSYLNFTTEVLTLPPRDDWDVMFMGYNDWAQWKTYDFVSRHGQSDSLLVVFSVGHASANGQLMGAMDAEDGPTFSLSKLQCLLRDCCPSDVLFVLDCCHAGFVPEQNADPNSAIGGQPLHIIETLAACPDKAVAACAPPHSFTERLAEQLILCAGQRLTVDQLSAALAEDSRHRAGTAFGINHRETTANIRHLNCGDRSIVLSPAGSIGAGCNTRGWHLIGECGSCFINSAL